MTAIPESTQGGEIALTYIAPVEGASVKLFYKPQSRPVIDVLCQPSHSITVNVEPPLWPQISRLFGLLVVGEIWDASDDDSQDD